MYYNPLRIFMLLSMLLIAASVALIGLNVFLHTVGLFYIAIGCVMMSIQTFATGLIAALLKQILQHQQQQSAGGKAPPAQAEAKKKGRSRSDLMIDERSGKDLRHATRRSRILANSGPYILKTGATTVQSSC